MRTHRSIALPLPFLNIVNIVIAALTTLAVFAGTFVINRLGLDRLTAGTGRATPMRWWSSRRTWSPAAGTGFRWFSHTADIAAGQDRWRRAAGAWLAPHRHSLPARAATC